MLGQCCLCDGHDRPPVAVCCRCGAFVCREHVLRLVHRAPRTPVGMVAPAPRRKTRLEMVCEACYLNELSAREPARKRAV